MSAEQRARAPAAATSRPRSARCSRRRRACSRRKLAEAGIDSADDITDLDDINRIPVTRQAGPARQRDRAPAARRLPLHARCRSACASASRPARPGTPTITAFTRHDLWLEYESAARNWWRNGWRPGQTVTHCHPAYLYGGGLMLSGTLEYFGFLNLWVPPPDTDELAEQAIRVWQRIHPDVQMVTLSQHRFQEVAAKLGHRPAGRLRVPRVLDGWLRPRAHAAHDRGHRVLRLPRRRRTRRATAPTSTRTGRSSRPSTRRRARDVPEGQWGNLVVTTLDRDNGAAALRPGRGGDARVGRLPARRDEPARFLGRPVQGPAQQPGRALPGVGTGEGGGLGEGAGQTDARVRRGQAGRFAPIRCGSASRWARDEGPPSDDRRAQLAGQVGEAVRSALGVESKVDVLDRDTLASSGYKLKRVSPRSRCVAVARPTRVRPGARSPGHRLPAAGAWSAGAERRRSEAAARRAPGRRPEPGTRDQGEGRRRRRSVRAVRRSGDDVLEPDGQEAIRSEWRRGRDGRPRPGQTSTCRTARPADRRRANRRPLPPRRPDQPRGHDAVEQLHGHAVRGVVPHGQRDLAPVARRWTRRASGKSRTRSPT